jgi:hypothetical protein
MYARKRGMQESKYRYMLYCDDDNWLNPNYFNIAYNVISEKDEIAAVGGKGITVFEKDFIVPEWMEKFDRSFGVGSQGKYSGDITNLKGCLYTAGAILDLKWIDRLYSYGFKSSLKGRDGNSLIAGEDTELTYALKLIGGKLYYNSDMSFKHFMPSGRIQWEYLKKLWWAFGYAEYVISPYTYFMNHEPYPNNKVLLFKNIKKLTILILKKAINSSKEGDVILLDIMRSKGELTAIFNKKKSFITNVKMIKKLHANIND